MALAGRQLNRRGETADQVAAVGDALAVEMLGLAPWWYVAGEEIVLDHGDPAILHIPVQVPTGELVETVLLVFVFRAVDGTAGVGVHEDTATIRRFAALELAIFTSGPQRVRTILDPMRDLYIVGTTVEGIDLVNLDAGLGLPDQVYLQAVLPIGHDVTSLRTAVDRLVGRGVVLVGGE